MVAPYVRHAGFAVRRPWRMGPRRLLDYLLVHVREGVLELTVDGRPLRLQPGSFCLVQPDELHELRGIGSTVTPYAHFDVFLNPRRRDSFPTMPGQTELASLRELQQPRLNDLPGSAVPTVLAPCEPEKFAAALTRLVAAWERGDPLSRLEANAHAMELVIAIVRDHSALPRHAAWPSRLDWARSYMSYHLDEGLPVAWLAERARLSPAHFAKLFTRQFGAPPHRYLVALRVQKARELLAGTDLSQARIAECCGFADLYHFSKVFKRHTGSSPRDFRRQGR